MKTHPLIYAFLLLSAGSLLTSCGGNGEAKESTTENNRENRVLTVRTFTVQQQQPESDVVLPGDLKPWEETQLYAKVKGFVSHLSVDRGSAVKKGDLLLTLEAPELVADLNNEKAKTEEYLSQYAASKATYQRTLQTSRTAGSVAANELERSYSKMQADSAIIAASRASLRAREAMVGYLQVRAPFDGIISERNVSPGALVGPDGGSVNKPMLVLKDNKKLRLTVAVPERYSSQMEPDAKVTFRVSSWPDRKFSAVLARSAQSVSESVRAMMTEFDVQNPNLELKSGMFADVDIPVKRTAPTLFVPASAVVNSTEQVFVIRVANGRAQRVNVSTGATFNDQVEVFGNLKEGETIVGNASEEIREGQPVNAVQSSSK